MKIGLVSDVHADPEPLEEALRVFDAHGVERILCAGDIAGYGERLPECVSLLSVARCDAVLGNHDQWHAERWQGPPREAEAYLRSLPQRLELQIGDISLHVLHASPGDPLHEGIRLRDENGVFVQDDCRAWGRILSDYPSDILIVGHTHQVFAIQLGALLLINPGSSCFNHSCMILELPAQKVEIFPLSGKVPQLSWNFGMERRN